MSQGHELLGLQSLKHSTFRFFCAFTGRSQCIFCACALRSVRTHHSRSSHHVLTRFSQSITLHSPLVWHLLIVQSDDIKFRLITIHTCSLIICYFFLSTDKTQCKNNSLGSRNKLFILCSHIFHRSLCAQHSLTIHHS